jgi:hypothetical protein
MNIALTRVLPPAASLPLLPTLGQTSSPEHVGLCVLEADVLSLPLECQIGQGMQGAVFRASVVDQTGKRVAVAVKVSPVRPVAWSAGVASLFLLHSCSCIHNDSVNLVRVYATGWSCVGMRHLHLSCASIAAGEQLPHVTCSCSVPSLTYLSDTPSGPFVDE